MQCKTEKTTVKQVFRQAEFKLGMSDARRGLPLRDVWDLERKFSWRKRGVYQDAYERGRQFYISCEVARVEPSVKQLAIMVRNGTII